MPPTILSSWTWGSRISYKHLVCRTWTILSFLPCRNLISHFWLPGSRKPARHQVDSWWGVWHCVFHLKMKYIMIFIIWTRRPSQKDPFAQHRVWLRKLAWLVGQWCVFFLSETQNHPCSLMINFGVFYYRSLVCACHRFTSFSLSQGNHHEQGITLHSFCVLVLWWSTPNHISKLVVLMFWFFTALTIAIPSIIHMKERYYGSVEYCKSGIFLGFLFLKRLFGKHAG